eukprot:jgi/Hompol1/3533/HPOL_006598-RA
MWFGIQVGVFQSIAEVSLGSVLLIIVYYGSRLVISGNLTDGQLVAYMLSAQSIQESLAYAGVLMGQSSNAIASASRIFEFVHRESKIPIRGGLSPESLNGTIEFRNVEFKYPTRPKHPVLERFSLIVPAGKVIALCGSSGSGKSTVAQLIERFYDPDSGAVLLDGIDIRDLDPKWLRSRIGYIGQEPILFATSLIENIRYGRPDATDEQVYEAARQANAHDFVTAFPDGYQTVVGERGVTLSGGQRQRLAIARAILKNPQILVLDEATSALDTQSERIVQDALERIMKGRTVLVIAHRLSTIQNADQIVVLSGAGKSMRESGNVVEMGTHSQLMLKRGAYYNLTKSHRDP